MPADQVTCSSCNTRLRLPAPAATGTRFRCPKCQGIVTVGDSPPVVAQPAVAAAQAAVPSRPQAVTPPAPGKTVAPDTGAASPARTAAGRVSDPEKVGLYSGRDPAATVAYVPAMTAPPAPNVPVLGSRADAIATDGPAPVPAQARGLSRKALARAFSNMSPSRRWSLIGGGAGVALLAVTLVVWSLTGGKNKGEPSAPPASQTAAAPTSSASGLASASPSGAVTKPVGDSRPEPKTETVSLIKPQAPAEPRPVVRQEPNTEPAPAGPGPVVRQEPKTEPAPVAVKPPPAPAADGSLTRAVVDKIKAATVYIRVTSADGRIGSGSGFLEQQSSLILTNAHVVGMLKPDAQQPRKIDVVFNSGRADEVAANGSIVTVDRSSDLAVLRVDLPVEKLGKVPRLEVKSGADLFETQRVFIAGFPLGEQVSKHPTISQSSVSAMHRDPDNNLTRIQVNGGMDHGNSGGPVVDPQGNVVGVSVAIIEGTLINYAIPGDYVQKVLEGRLSTLNLARDLQRRDGKFVVDLHLGFIDPLARIQKVEVDYWSGSPANKPPKVSRTRPDIGPDAATRRTLPVAYQASAGQGTAQITLDALPAPGKSLWVQVIVTHAGGASTWMGAAPFRLYAPVDPKPALLVTSRQAGMVPMLLQSSDRYKIEAPRSDPVTYTREILTRLRENTVATGPDSSQVQLSIQSFATGVFREGKSLPASEDVKAAIREMGKLTMDLTISGQGTVSNKKNDLTRVAAASRKLVGVYGDQIQQSFDASVIPLPGGPNLTQPGDQWQTARPVTIDLLEDAAPAIMNVTYTYRGTRQQDGREVAVVDLRGVLQPQREGRLLIRGTSTGSAMIEVRTGFLLEASSTTEMAVSVSSGFGMGGRRRSGGISEPLQLKGTLMSHIQRGPDVK